MTKANTRLSPWSVRWHRPFLLRRPASDNDKLKNQHNVAPLAEKSLPPAEDNRLVEHSSGGGKLTDSGINQIRMKGTLMTGQSRRKLSVIGIIALFACVIALALIFLIQTCGLSNGTFYYRHSDNGMYDDATAITAQVAKSSNGFLSFTADPEKACAGTIECLGFGGRDNLAMIDSPQSNQTASVSINLFCTRGRAKVVLYQIESGNYNTLAEGTATFNDVVSLPEGTSIIALIGDKADVVCDFEIAANEGASAALAMTDR